MYSVCVEQNKVHIMLAKAVKEILHMYSSLINDKLPIVVFILNVFNVCRTEYSPH